MRKKFVVEAEAEGKRAFLVIQDKGKMVPEWGIVGGPYKTKEEALSAYSVIKNINNIGQA